MSKARARVEREQLAREDKKRCTKCRRVKAFEEFSLNAQNPDGFAYYCRSCNAGKQKDWKHEHPARIKRWRKDARAAKRAE
jgi:late competence protein required for DNA uptake (superfamily II DNA/RNA helicase)